MRHQVATRIDAPAAEVWRVVSEVTRWPEWTPTMTEVRWLDGGDLRESCAAEVRQPGQPRRVWTVTELTPGRSFTWVAGGAGLRMTADHVVTADGDATVVELSFGVAGPLAPLVGLLTGRTIRRALATEAASLKAWCERAR